MTTTVITTLPFSTLVQEAVDQWASNTINPPVLNQGDPLLAIFQASAAQAVFLESLCELIADYGRAQTATGAALDTWMAQFGFVRLAADPATGQVTFSTSSVLGFNVVIPVGTLVQTAGGALQFQVIADTTQVAYSATQNAYIITAGNTSCVATVQATTAGAVGNVAAATITQMLSSVPGVASVTNAAAFTTGQDQESDTAFFNRWLSFLQSLTQGTLAAITAAIQAVQSGLNFSLLDNTFTTGSQLFGFFTVVLMNGAQLPSSQLIAAVQQAAFNSRAFTVQCATIAPSVDTVTVQLAVHPTATAPITLTTDVQTAIVNYINALPIGATLFISSLTNVALGVTGVASVQSGVIINGSTADFAPTALQVVRTITGNVTINTY